MFTSSPYANQPASKWLAITDQLIKVHPLSIELIHEVALVCWKNIWATTIGSGKTQIKLADISVPASVVGYFFEVLFAKELSVRFPDVWRGTKSGDEKDLVHIKNAKYSVEIKTSGQLGHRVYGNRSYCQEVKNKQHAKKAKSGYYLTANFHERTLMLLRFGWIDASDWKPQTAPTGQMAGLSDEVYASKLVSIPGEYRLDAPITLVRGIGQKIAEEFGKHGISTIRQMLAWQGTFKDRRLHSLCNEVKVKYTEK